MATKYVTFGEIMLRLSPPRHERITDGDIFEKRAGGAELNVASGVALLGLRTGIISKLPANKLGTFLKNRIRFVGVSDDYLIYDESPEARLGLYYYEMGAAPRKPTIVYDRKESSATRIRLDEIPSEVYKSARMFHTSGISLAVMRLVSEELGKNNGKGAIQAVRHCIAYALIFGCTASVLLFFGADFISAHILRDARTYLALRILAIALPFIALSNIFQGYFNAVRRVYKNASASIAEQFIKIFITVSLLIAIAPRGTEYACLALVVGTAAAEGLSFFYLLIFYLVDKKRHIQADKGTLQPDMKRRMLSISLPIALSSYLRSGLVTIEHILIPIGLRRHGSDYQTALTSYGTIHGMVFPLILFPSAVCSTFAGLIVPELSELAAKYGNVRGNKHICYIVKRALCFSLLFGIGTAGIFLCFARPLGLLVYGSEEAVKYIGIFASLIPVMYLDTAVDGMIKGLGQQFNSMIYNIIDASMSVLLVWTLMPKIGIYGYVICVFLTELVNLAFSLNRLLTVTVVKIPLCRAILSPVVCIVGATSLATLAVRLALPASLSYLAVTVVGILLSLLFYLILLRTTQGLTKEDTAWLKSILKDPKPAHAVQKT